MADNIPLKIESGQIKQFASTDTIPSNNLPSSVYPTAWTSKVAITIGAVTTAPTKATVKENDFIRSRNWGQNIIEVDMLYSANANAGAANGSGNYLYTLPDSYSFNTSEHPLFTGTTTRGIAGLYSVGRNEGGFVNANNIYYCTTAIVPYTATKFRLLMITGDFSNAWVGSVIYYLNDTFEYHSANFKFIKA